MTVTQKYVDKVLGEAERLCKIEGSTLTKLRRRVLETLIKAPGPVKAYDLIESLKTNGRSLTPSSIYRTLEFFIQTGLVHRVNSLNAFVACTDHKSHHNPVILVCPSCQATAEVNDEGLYTSIFNRLNAMDFFAKEGSVEVRGLCKKCAKEALELEPHH
ncbi:MAG: transcriptional repressor [Deltaproteobacteria bacterium]|jgi:Fur family zinc uptake transcriptional regulator|nr:transcriptional repressor [Deltaproteobacteria bacterium]